MHLRILTRLCLVAAVCAGLAAPAMAGSLRCDLPLNQTGAVPLRITWDGRGELLVTTRPAYGPPDRLIVTRQGAGASWVPLADSAAEHDLLATVQQRVNGRVVAEEAVYTERKHITALWLGRPDFDTKQRRALANLWPSRYDDADLAVGPPEQMLPDRTPMLRQLRAVVVDAPLSPAQTAVLTTYARAGGLLVARDGLTTWPVDTKPVVVGGEPRVRSYALGRGRLLLVDGALPLAAAAWTRLLVGDLRRPSPDNCADLPPLTQLARGLDQTKPIPSRQLLAFLLGYLAFAGPLTWVAVRRSRRRSTPRGWLSTPLVAAAAVLMAAIWVNQVGRRAGAAYQVTSSVVPAGERLAIAETVLRLATGPATTFTVSGIDPTATEDTDNSSCTVQVQGSRLGLGPWAIPTRSARIARITAMADLGGSVDIAMTSDQGDSTGFRLHNGLPYALRGAVLVTPTHIRPVGTLAAGQTLTVKPDHSAWQTLPLKDREARAALVQGLARSDAPAAARAIAAHLAAMPTPRYGSGDRSVLSGQHVALVGWVDRPWHSYDIKPRPSSLQQAQLLTVVAKQTPTEDDGRYRLSQLAQHRGDSSYLTSFGCDGKLPSVPDRLRVRSEAKDRYLWNFATSRWVALPDTPQTKVLPARDFLREGLAVLRSDGLGDVHESPPDDDDDSLRVTQTRSELKYITAIVEDRHGRR